MNHLFDVNIATEFSVDTAVFLSNIHFWTVQNLANKTNIIDGHCWTYNSLEAFCDLFPYWTKRQCERVINNAVKQGLVKKGNYNANKYDKTCWYALTYKSYAYYPDLLKEKYLKALYNNISPNGDIEFSEWCHRSFGIVTPIPDSKPDTKPYINNNKVSKNKSSTLTPKEMHDNNPHEIPHGLLQEWRSSRKKPITERVLNALNRELGKLKDAGIEPSDAFNKMLDRQWSTVEFKFFEQDIALLKGNKSSRPKNSSDVFYNYISKQTQGTDYDQDGNVVDSFSF